MSKQDSPSVIVPIVHLNGTSKAELLELRETAYLKLGEAFESLKQMAPHGRDYYPKPGLLEQATAQHRRRLQAIDAIRKELEAEAIAIQKGE